MKRVLRVVLVLSMLLVSNAPSQTQQNNLPVTDGAIYSMAVDEANKKLYIGGAFSMIGPSTGQGVAISKTTGSIDNAYPRITGNVFAVASDGNGGWYVGGLLSRVGSTTRFYLAHIKSDKTLDGSWNPSPNGVVNSIVVSGSTIYVGGNFTSIGGQTRNRIAAMDATTGNATAWNPDCDAPVNDIFVAGSTIYVGGNFANIGGQSRNKAAALDASTGNASSWNPGADNQVYKIVVSGTRVFVAGQFMNIGGQARTGFAVLDAQTGAATSWNANTTGPGVTLALSGSRLYVGGLFSSIGGQSRSNIAALDTGTAVALPWNPNLSSIPWAIVVEDSSVYAGGDFTTIGGQPKSFFAALDTVSGSARSWNPSPNNSVRALAISGSVVYAGGLFSSAGGAARNNIASVDLVSGAVSNWNPNANSEVWSLVLSGSKLYAGGYFTNIGGQSRGYIAALDTGTGTATSWNPNSDYYIYRIAISGSTVYAAGDFANIGGQARNRIAALDATTGNATSWNPNADNFVRSVAISGSTVYLGGMFTNIGGQARSRIAAIDAATGNATTWNPGANEAVWEIIVSGSTVYASGTFTQVGGQSRNRIGAVDATTGNATSWNPNASGLVFSMKLSGSILYAGGDFFNIDGQGRSGIAALDVATGKATSWNPSLAGTVRPVAESPVLDKVYVGGSFYAVDNESRTNLAGFSRATPVDFVAPAVPQNLVVSDTLDQSLKVKWRKISYEPDFRYYYIYRATSPNPTTRIDTAQAGLNDTSKTYTGLTNGTRYYFRVTAVDTTGNESAYSNEVSAVPGNPNLPTAPMGLYAIAGNGNGQVTLTWLKNQEPNVQRYRILRGTSSPATTPVDSTATGNDTTKTISSLSNGTLYYFRVMGVGITGLEGAASVEDAAVPIKSPGRVITFSSGGGNVNLPASDFVTASVKTIAAWIKPTGTSPTVTSVWQGQHIVGDGGGGYFGIYRETIAAEDRIWVYNFFSGSGDRVGISYVAGQWIHVALVHDGTKLFAYKNGIVVDSIASGPTSVVSQSFRVGTSYAGSMDELSVWRKVLSPSEVLSLATTTPTGLEQALTGYWRFDEPSGVVAYDGSLAGRNMTMSNGTISAAHRFVPAIPGSLTVTDSSSTKLSVRWTRSADTDFLRYRVYRGAAPNPTIKVDSTAGGNIGDTTKAFTGLTNGLRYYVRVTAVDSAGYESDYSNEVHAAPNAALSAEDVASQIPKEYSLSQNYPNPFNPSTVIRFGLPEKSHVTLEVYNLMGQKIATLIDGEREARYHEVSWQAGVSSGIYFYRLSAVASNDPSKAFVEIRKMILLR